MTNNFRKDIIPFNEKLRLEVLNKYVLLDCYPDKYFNRIASIIAKTFQTKIALISFVGSAKVEFKGNFGMEETSSVDRGISLCSLVILDNNALIFEDATKEPCLLDNPLVAGDFGLQFYAGVPLTSKEGLNIGTVCIIDKEPRSFSKDEINLLTKFARNVMTELEERQIVRISDIP